MLLQVQAELQLGLIVSTVDAPSRAQIGEILSCQPMWMPKRMTLECALLLRGIVSSLHSQHRGQEVFCVAGSYQ